jgi:hypothetical protein
VGFFPRRFVLRGTKIMPKQGALIRKSFMPPEPTATTIG